MSGEYLISISTQAKDDIIGLTKQDQKKVIRALEKLAVSPRPHGVEKLKENPSFWRLKLGRNHRLVYTIDDQARAIIIALVRHRKEAYRHLNLLDRGKLLAELEPVISQARISTLAQ